MKQVSKEHYDFSSYVGKDRWMSYYYQVKEAVDAECETYLVIGTGDGIVPDMIRKCGGVVDTLDVDPELSPTYAGDVRDLREIVKQKYDCVICCQVLEHLEWRHFENIVGQIADVCRKRAVLSLPVSGLSFSLLVDMPKIHLPRLCMVMERFWKREIPWDGEHYWEVGLREQCKRDVLRILGKHFDVKREYVVPENTYHWFAIMDCR